jgi:hypothetical protein
VNLRKDHCTHNYANQRTVVVPRGIALGGAIAGDAVESVSLLSSGRESDVLRRRGAGFAPSSAGVSLCVALIIRGWALLSSTVPTLSFNGPSWVRSRNTVVGALVPIFPHSRTLSNHIFLRLSFELCPP